MQIKKSYLPLCLLLSLGSLIAEESWTLGDPQTISNAIYETTKEALTYEDFSLRPMLPRKALIYPNIEMDEEAPLLPVTEKPCCNSFSLNTVQYSITENSQNSLFPNFTAATLPESGFIPPDSDGAVGPSQYIAVINGLIRSFSKTGSTDGVLNTSTNSFFGSVMIPGGTAGDPRIRYDRFSSRWYIAMIEFMPFGGYNQILLAVSNSSTITAQTVWSFFSFFPAAVTPARSNLTDYSDFTTLGIDRFALYIGVNVFSGSTGGFTNSDAFVINKANLINGSLTVTVFRNLIDPFTFVGPISPQGVDVFDSNSLEGYFIGVNANNLNSLVLRRIATPGGTPSISGNIIIPIPSTTLPIKIPHKGNTLGTNGYLDAIDNRLSHCHVRDKKLYSSHNIGVDANGISSPFANISATGSRFYEINLLNPAFPTLLQNATLFDPGSNFSLRRNFWIPSVMTNGLHNLVLGCSTAGQPYFVDSAFSQQLVSDCKGTLRPTTIYTQSSTSYNPSFDLGGSRGRRWGDFSTISPDPLDNMTLWSIQEFCNAANSWGCQVVKILAPPPPPFFISPTNIAPNSSTTLTIVGAGTNGSAFYNPPADFPNHITATLGGCKVNFIQVISPTQISINISTVGCSGIKTMQITNPDGQTSSSLNTITVCP